MNDSFNLTTYNVDMFKGISNFTAINPNLKKPNAFHRI